MAELWGPVERALPPSVVPGPRMMNRSGANSRAATVTARTRRTDACGRLDGGRFGLVLPNAAPAQAESLLRDIRATLADFEVREGEGAGGLTISCGLADFPTFDAPRAMSQAAEAALQTAREGGGDRVIRGK